MKWTTTSPPANSIIDFNDIGYHLRDDDDVLATTAEQNYLTRLIAAATDFAETLMQTSLVTRTIAATFYRGDKLVLPRGPVISILSCIDANGPISYTLETQGNTDYLVTPNSFSAPLIVTYTAGYGTAADCPPMVVQSICTHVATLYENRESISDKTMMVVPHSLADFYKMKSRGSAVA